MLNSFLFIIPLTPKTHLTPLRSSLRQLCFNALATQTYGNWKAMLIGYTTEEEKLHENFILVNYEGAKEEKLQIATQYILEQNLHCDYIIRLDDDDIFNPTLLTELANRTFDLFTDKYHTFLDVSTGLLTQQVLYWFPNSCILAKKHALTVFGVYPPEDQGKSYKKFKELAFLIENGHADFHFYFNANHTILFANKNNPAYVRTLYPDSHSSTFSGGHEKFMNNFGDWRKNTFQAFQFLKGFPKIISPLSSGKSQGLNALLKNRLANLRAALNYEKVVIKNNTERK